MCMFVYVPAGVLGVIGGVPVGVQDAEDAEDAPRGDGLIQDAGTAK